MLVRSLTNPYRVFSYLAPDAGDGAGGGSGDDSNVTQDPPAKTYTEEELQKQLEKSMARWRKSLQKELDETKRKNEEFAKTIDELKAAQAPPKTEDTVEGRIELLQKRHQEQLDEINRKMAEAENARKAAEQRAKETQRDTIIQKALQEAGCRDLTIGYRTVIPDIEFDELDEEYRIKTPAGNTVEITGENLKQLLPDFLRHSSTAGGGSGSVSGGTRIQQKLNELAAEKAKAAELHKLPGTPDNVQKYLVQRAKVKALEAEIANAKK